MLFSVLFSRNNHIKRSPWQRITTQPSQIRSKFKVLPNYSRANNERQAVDRLIGLFQLVCIHTAYPIEEICCIDRVLFDITSAGNQNCKLNFLLHRRFPFERLGYCNKKNNENQLRFLYLFGFQDQLVFLV